MISRLSVINAAGVAAALAAALVAATLGAPERFVVAPAATASTEVINLPDGRRGIRDATGYVVDLKPYRRILAASTIADGLLHELAEPDRVVGVTAYGRAQSPWAYQQADKPVLSGVDDVEAVLLLAPDLVVLNSFGQIAKVARLRERGIEVFDLGEMRGVGMVVRDIHVVAILLGHPERGQRLASTWQRRFAAIDDGLGSRPRRRAIYLATYGGKLFGGTRSSSYGDVLDAAGVVDVAATTFEGWPQYDPEQILSLDPELIVTKPGMGVELCRVAGLARLRSCRSPDGFVEVDAALLDDPGLPMLDAAEQIFAAAYPAPALQRR